MLYTMGFLNGQFLYRYLEQSKLYLLSVHASCAPIKPKPLALLAMLYCLSYRNVMAINVMHVINFNK